MTTQKFNLRAEALKQYNQDAFGSPETATCEDMWAWENAWYDDMTAYYNELEAAEMAWDVATRANLWKWFTADPDEDEWDD